MQSRARKNTAPLIVALVNRSSVDSLVVRSSVDFLVVHSSVTVLDGRSSVDARVYSAVDALDVRSSVEDLERYRGKWQQEKSGLDSGILAVSVSVFVLSVCPKPVGATSRG